MTQQRLIPRQRLTPESGITLEYCDEGAGKPIVFIAGLLVNGDLWRKVIAQLSGHYRCIAFDLPLGAHRVAMPADAALSPQFVAGLIGEAISALDLQDVTLVGVDTGGALSQLVFAYHGERIGRLLLSNCDAFGSFPPKILRPFLWFAYVPGGMVTLRALMQWKPMQTFILWLLQRSKADSALRASYFAPMRDHAILRDLKKFMRAVDARDTVEVAKRLPAIDKPALLVWARGDWFFTDALARRLCGIFAKGQLQWVTKSKTLVAEDQPDELVRHLTRFIRETSTA